jgi:glycosyltransferase involved in cell wall biosynthesis
LTRELAARGHEVGLAVDNLHSDGLTQQRLQALGASAVLGIHSFPIPRLLGAADFTTPFSIRRLAEELGIQVLHGHGAKGGLNARLARAGGNRRVALYTPHGGTLNYRPGSLVGGVLRLIERALLAQTDAVIFESAFAQRTFYGQILEPKCPSPVVHNGLSPAEFAPLTTAPDARDFLFIGEFRPVKGIEYMLDALPGVKSADGRPATLAMAGDGPDRPKVEAQIANLGLTDRVTLLGAQPARAAMPLGRCVLVPSIAESLPYVILEATSAERPVIATQVGGIAEIFGPTAASLVPSGNPAALRQAMQAFMDDPDAANREMRERLAYVAPRFSIAHMTDQIEALYRRVLADR